MGNVTRIALEVIGRTEQQPLRAVIYVRVSTDEQTKGFGIAYTEKKCLRHLERKGWTYVKTYADEGYSGSLDHTQRPDLKELMADSQKTPRPFDVVVVPEERAIGRAGRAFWPWVWGLEDLGVFTAVVRGDYDNTTDEGRKRMRDEQGRAEDERIWIRDRTQGGIQEKAEIGGHPGGTTPFGWRIEDKGKKGLSRLVLDTGEGGAYDLLHRSWQHIVEEHMNPNSVEDLFNREGIAGPTQDYWPRGSLRRILTGRAIQESIRVHRDPKGVKTRLDADGRPRFGETVVIKLDPVFTPEQLVRLNAALARTARPGQTVYGIHPLSGRLFGLCGKHYTGVSKTGRNAVRAYRCAGKDIVKGKAESRRCSCAQIDAELVEKRVWGEVCRLLADPDQLLALAEEWSGTASFSEADHEARIADLERQIAEQEEVIDLAIPVAARQAARRGFTGAEARKAMENSIRSLTEELERLEEQRQTAVAWLEESRDTASRGRDLKALAEMARERLHTMTLAEQDEVYALLDVRVTILEGIPRKVRSDDQISEWFRKRGRVVPELTDEEWALVEPVITAPRAGRKAADPRGLLECILHKARTGCAWMAVPGSGKAVLSAWQRWSTNGIWDQTMDLLADAPGTPVPTDGLTLPKLSVEGRVDPRLFVQAGKSPTGDAPLEDRKSREIRFRTELGL